MQAAYNGYVEIVKLCKEWGVTEFGAVILEAAYNGHDEIFKLCKEWGATDFERAMWREAFSGHVEIVKLCKEWGATDFDEAMWWAAWNGHHMEIVKLCRGWLGYNALHDDLLRYHHKRKFYKKLYADLLPVGWYPDRVVDWCIPEDEKRDLKELWK